MDAIDQRIISILRADGRITNAELAEKVGLSPSACLRRVRLLEESGTIWEYSALINDKTAAPETVVIVQITLERQTDEYLNSRDCLRELRQETGITYYHGKRGLLQLFRTQKQLDGIGEDTAPRWWVRPGTRTCTRIRAMGPWAGPWPATPGPCSPT